MVREASSASSPPKKHVTTACLFCRRRKIKCDGRSPTCSNCQQFDQACQYNASDDKRKISVKKATSSLRARLAQLEEVLQAHNIEIPPAPLDRQQEINDSAGHHTSASTSLNVQNHNGQPSNNRQGPSTGDTGIVAAPITQSSEAFDSSTRIGADEDRVNYVNEITAQERAADSINETNLGIGTVIEDTGTEGLALFNDSFDLNADSPPSPLLQSNEPVDAVQPDEQSDDITEYLAARMGSLQIAEDGQLRYYGPTSNLNGAYHNGLLSLSRSNIRSVAGEGTIALQRAGLGQVVDPSIELHLARLYFAWEDPAIHVVDEEIYFLERDKRLRGDINTQYYSETLNNAICAVGASLSADGNLGLPEPASEFFSARAKVLLEIEMDGPTVATVQALVIMSASEAAATRDARGWLYSGMAVRLSADLGLHLDLTEHLRAGKLSRRDVDVRRTTFWGVFIHDNMWSMYVGRPWGVSIRDISVSRPIPALDSIRRKRWQSYRSRSEAPNFSLELGIMDPVEACSDANISLCVMMRQISRTLYAGRKIPINELVKFASDMRRDFSRWLDSLPPELKINMAYPDRIYLPHVLQLHMQFYVLSIFLHRPYFARELLRHTRLINTADRDRPESIRSACIRAAHNIAELLRLYRKQHGFSHTNVQMVHLIFTASLIHIYTSCACNDAEAQAAADDLQTCCQALGEIGRTYGNSTRALEVIICIKREWQNLAAARKTKAPAKRQSEFQDDGDASANKRRIESQIDDYPPQLQTLSEPEQMLVPGIDVLEQNDEVYDAWQFLNWAEMGMDLPDGINSQDGGQLTANSNWIGD